ncbi:DUF2267 domain-containing protein [Sciscionella sediminilitoris]|uniref:DUF2267 domain-containing protein n=1 Tax=Sciscionella sediminilitoris TaxID=1445613 RepID=UPI00210073D7|nr:DUF2267 domain-containing protein [Sciscionella sp. SE31]
MSIRRRIDAPFLGPTVIWCAHRRCRRNLAQGSGKPPVGLSDDEHARNATEATLTVLGQRLAGNEPADLAAQLPPSVAEALPESGGRGTFGLEEFYRRAGDAEGRGCTQDAAREHARAVVAALLSRFLKNNPIPGVRNP